MTADVLGELARAQHLRQADLDVFITGEGVPPLALARTAGGRYDFLVRDRVQFDGARFEFERHLRDSDRGQDAYVLPLRNECGDLTDLLAFWPDVVATWLGSPLAGAENIHGPRLGEPLDVYPDVVAWLRAARDGILILDPARAAAMLVGVTLRTATLAQARRLRLELARPAPRIVTREPVTSARKRLAMPRRA